MNSKNNVKSIFELSCTYSCPSEKKKPLCVHGFLKIQQKKVFLKPQPKGKGLTL